MTRKHQAAYQQTDKGIATRRRYDHSEKGRATRQEARRAYEERNRAAVTIRKRASLAVWRAVDEGRLVKTACLCGEIEVEGHHPNGYDDDHILDVVWLCVRHHREAHGRR